MRYSGAVQRKLVNHHKGLAAAIIVFGVSAVYPVASLAGQRPIWRRVAATTANISGHTRGHKNDMASVDQPHERQCNWLNPPQIPTVSPSHNGCFWYLVFIQYLNALNRHGDPSRLKRMSPSSSKNLFKTIPECGLRILPACAHGVHSASKSMLSGAQKRGARLSGPRLAGA